MYTVKSFCLYCGKLVRGRSDKKFCDDYCRNSHNNHKRMVDGEDVRSIFGILKTNQRILLNLIGKEEEFAKVPLIELCEMGYNFKYHTHTNLSSSKLFFQFCFDVGIHKHTNGLVIVVRDFGDSYLNDFCNKHFKEQCSSEDKSQSR